MTARLVPIATRIGSLPNTTSAGWRSVDVTNHFMADWNAGKPVSVYAVRFATPTSGDGQDHDVDLAPNQEGQIPWARLVLQWGVDL